MHRRRDPAVMAVLAKVQAVRQLAAQAALVDAQAAEATAVDGVQDARRHLNDATEHWRDVLARPGFAPEHARGVAHVLISREGDAAAAAEALRLAADDYGDRQRAWRIADTRERTAARDLKAARQAAARHRENRRVDALADRLTHGWRRP